MSSPQITARVGELTVARTPFVRATVVRAQAPTSVHAGDDAIVMADGTLEGFVGGQCTQNSVRTAALAALTESTATLLRVLPDDSDPFPATPGAQVVVNPCHSGGAVEIFLEPVLPPPLLTVTGTTPIAEALRSMAGFLGYSIIERADSAAEMPANIRTIEDLSNCSAVIVASHGPGEDESIRAALDAHVPYIGLVGSKKRSTALFDDMGLTEAERSRIDAPAGQWIGARTPPEIALSIMAEVVAQLRIDDDGHRKSSEKTLSMTSPKATLSSGNSANVSTSVSKDSAAPTGVLEPVQAIDPVCHMTVTVMPDTPQLRIDSVDYYFCNPGCRERFAAQHAESVGEDTVAPAAPSDATADDLVDSAAGQ